MLISKLKVNTILSKRAMLSYLLVLAVTIGLWMIVISGYIFVQLYIYPIETIVTFIIIGILSIFKTYILFRMTSDLPWLEEVLDDKYRKNS